MVIESSAQQDPPRLEIEPCCGSSLALSMHSTALTSSLFLVAILLIAVLAPPRANASPYRKRVKFAEPDLLGRAAFVLDPAAAG
jgi:hypothetical protein